MRFGVCAGPEKAELLAEAGYDFIELSVAGHLMTIDDDAAWLRETGAALRALPIPPETFNSFVRIGKLVGPDVDFEYLKRYVKSAFLRASAIGGRIIVFGSGGARTIPEGFDPTQARQQLNNFLSYCANCTVRSGIILAIEPLQQAESNMVNLVSEGAALAREIVSPAIRVLGDTFHMERENEPLAALSEARDVLAHVHVADSGRLAPGTGTYDYDALFRTLKAADYDQRIAIECSFGSDFSGEVTHALATLKAAHSAALRQS